jgi:hypothetical protein
MDVCRGALRDCFHERDGAGQRKMGLVAFIRAEHGWIRPLPGETYLVGHGRYAHAGSRTRRPHRLCRHRRIRSAGRRPHRSAAESTTRRLFTKIPGRRHARGSKDRYRSLDCGTPFPAGEHSDRKSYRGPPVGLSRLAHRSERPPGSRAARRRHATNSHSRSLRRIENRDSVPTYAGSKDWWMDFPAERTRVNSCGVLAKITSSAMLVA